ncbi:unnamed protein product [Miscanthus lutarioriparius]|uniref:Uncharacterized protein n=1 Tax=Miscanthus lutarioriparius TaxID=422564 RepID=A0A811PFV1_9POAL|nr:unnamed protein product [Miscanthus lutarioriparius]
MRGRKIRKRFRFYRRDVFGTRTHRGGSDMVRLTPLGRELLLRMKLQIIKNIYSKIPGIYEWDAYKQHLPAIKVHMAAITKALEMYKARHVERGLFHFRPKPNLLGFWILCPWCVRGGAQARHEGLRKWRRRCKKRAAIAAAAALRNRPTMDHVSSLAEMKMRFMGARTMLYLAYLVFVSILSCIIVFM